MRLSILLVCLAASLVCGLPHTQDVRTLGEAEQSPEIVADAVRAAHSEPEEDPPHVQVKRVADAVHHVWMNSDLNAMFDKDIHDPKKHWTCKYCHRACKTIQCRQYCHEEHCGATIKFGKSGVGRMGISPGQRITPAFAQSVQTANKMLHKAEHAKSDSEFRAAQRAVKGVLEKQGSDLRHYQRQMGYADSINKMAYPTDQQRRAQEKATDDMEAANNKQEIDVSNGETREIEKTTAKNKGFEKTAEATAEADDAMGDKDPLMKEVQTDIDAQTDALNSGTKDKTTGSVEMTEVADVAAQVEKMGVKVKSASDEASDAADADTDSDERAIREAKEELGDAQP